MKNIYNSKSVERVYIPKKDDKKRLLAIPTVNSYCTSPNFVFDSKLGSLEPSIHLARWPDFYVPTMNSAFFCSYNWISQCHPGCAFFASIIPLEIQ
jgi:hypothetical protein